MTKPKKRYGEFEQVNGGVVNDLMDACAQKQEIIDSMEAEIVDLADRQLCDICESYALETTDEYDDGRQLGHVQCAQCSRIASLEERCRRYEERLRRVIGWRENDWPEGFCRRTAEMIAELATPRQLLD